MKLPDSKEINIEGSSFETKQTKVSEDNTGYIFNLLSKYSRPIDSIVREITSNCFDSHIEAGVNDPVVVKFGEDGNGGYISFIDVGVGLSPERMDKIYLDVGNSTKRNDANQIGSFGIGSKSPFSYTDAFYITTHHNGTTWEYMYYRKSKFTVPDLKLLLEYEEERRNGTEVKIYFVRSDDKYKFEEACRKELCYFDNVYFDHPQGSIVNFYNIYEGKHFKLRKDSYARQLHICLGKVSYPIDPLLYSGLSYNEEQFFKINPIALKFNIGDIPVEPKREALEYLPFIDKEGNETTTEQVIRNKIIKVKEELIELLQKQTPPVEEDLFKYMFIRDKEPKLILDKDANLTLDVSWMPSAQRTKQKVKFKPFIDNYFTGQLPINPFFDYTIVGEFNGIKIKLYEEDKYRRLDAKLLLDHIVVRYPETGKFSRIKNLYLLWLNKQLDLKLHKNTFYIVKEIREKPLRIIRNVLELSKKVKTKDFSKGNYLSQYQYYTDFIRNIVINDSIDYDNLDVAQEYKDIYKKLYSTATVTTKKEEGEIVVYDYLEFRTSMRKTYIKPKQALHKFTGIVIFGTKEDTKYLYGLASMFLSSDRFSRTVVSNARRTITMYDRVRVYEVAERNLKFFKYKNCIYVRNFMSNNKVFKRFTTALIIAKLYPDLKIRTYNNIELVDLVGYVNVKVQRDLKKVLDYMADHGGKVTFSGDTSLTDFVDELIELGSTYGIVDKNLIELADNLKNYVANLKLIKYLTFNPADPICISAVVEYFNAFGRIVNKMYKEQENSYEFSLCKELEDKISYMLEIKTANMEKERNSYTRSILNRHLEEYKKLADELSVLETTIKLYGSNETKAA